MKKKTLTFKIQKPRRQLECKESLRKDYSTSKTHMKYKEVETVLTKKRT